MVNNKISMGKKVCRINQRLLLINLMKLTCPRLKNSQDNKSSKIKNRKERENKIKTNLAKVIS